MREVGGSLPVYLCNSSGMIVEILKKLNDHYKLDLNNNVEIKNCVK